MNTSVEEVVNRVIKTIAEERNLDLPELRQDIEIVDELGFSSLMVAALIANLEEEFGVDPFMDEEVMIADIRTIKDLCEVYTRSLESNR